MKPIKVGGAEELSPVLRIVMINMDDLLQLFVEESQAQPPFCLLRSLS